MTEKRLEWAGLRLSTRIGLAAVLFLCTWGHMARAVKIGSVLGTPLGDPGIQVTAADTWLNTGLTVTVTDLPANTAVLVTSSFASKSPNGTGGGEQPNVEAWFRLSLNGGASFSPSVSRLHRGRSFGNEEMLGVINIFEGLSGDNTFELQHRADSTTMNTRSGNILAIPLVTVEDDVLNHAVTLDPGPYTTFTAPQYPAPDISSTVFVGGAAALGNPKAVVTLPSQGNILAVACCTTENDKPWPRTLTDPADPSYTPASVRHSLSFVDSTGTEIPIGQYVEKELRSTGKRGVSVIVALGEDLPAGDYALRMRHASGTHTTTTRDITLAAVALALPDGREFASYQVNRVGTSETTNNVFVTALTSDISLIEETDVLLAASFFSRGDRTRAYFRAIVDESGTPSPQPGTAQAVANDNRQAGTHIEMKENVAEGLHQAMLQFYGVPDGVADDREFMLDRPNLVVLVLSTTAVGNYLDLFRAYIHAWERESGRWVTILDTCRARNTNEARAVFLSRHPGSRIVSVAYIRDPTGRGYRLFLCGIRTADGKNTRDTCYALNPSDARRIVAARSPGRVVNHAGPYPSNRRSVTYYGVTQRPDLLDTMEAMDLKAAFKAFGQRYPRERIVRVTQVSSKNEFSIFEGTLDPKEVTEVLRAPDAGAAAAMALAKYARHRVLSVESSRSADGIATYEGRIHTKSGGVVRDSCSARSVADAQKIFKARHGKGSSPAVAEMDLNRGYRLFKAGVSIKGSVKSSMKTMKRD